MFKFKAFRVICVVITFSLFPVTTVTQVQNPTQTPATPPQITSPTDVVRVSTELVQTDVTVVDKQGHFVDNLSRDNFELLVDGKPQPITFFELVAAGSSKEAAVVASASKAPAPPSDGKSATPAPASPTVSDRGRTTLFFIDDLHLSPGSMKRTQDLLLKFLNQGMKSKDQALIGTASGQLGFLQQVTDNRDILRSAIDRLRYRPSDIADTLTSPVMNEYQAIAIENNNRDALGYFTDKQCEEFKKMGRGSCAPDTGLTNNAVYDDAVARNRSGGGGTTGTSPGPVAMSEESGRRGAVPNLLRPEAERLVRSRARMIARMSQQVTLNTLKSLESLIRAAAGIPERKVVIFISDGFLLNLAQSTSAYDLRRITDAALRSGAVIYTIDARGLVGGGPDASTKDGMDTAGRFTRLSMSEITALQEGLNNLADETGGRAWRNSNDLAPGIGRALAETSAYYLLAWRPEAPDQTKDSFRRIEVKIKDRPDLTVRVRGGFFAKDPIDSKASETTKALSDDDHLLAAIRAAYPRNGIPVTLSVGYLDKANEGMMVAASVQVDIGETGAATSSDSELNLIGAVVDDSGNILSSLKQKVTIPAGDAGKNGPMVLTLQFPKLTPGLRQVRIAARDSRSGRLGSAWQWVEIPNLTSAGLTLSSIFLTDGSTAGSQKPAIKPDGRFTQAGKLRFQTYVYNATAAGSKPNLVLQLELRRDGQSVIQTPPSPVTTEGVTDLARIPIVGEFPLASFPPGPYELNLQVTDQSSNKSASQRITFSIRSS